MKKFTKILAAILALCISFSMFTRPVSAASKFSDVTTKTSGYKQIMWASEKGIINGFSDGTFGPTKNCTRAQLAVMLWRFNGEPSVSGSSTFTDIGSYSANVQKAIVWAYKQGIVSGYENGKYYKPGDPITREQMAIMLWRMAGEPSVTTSGNPFSDISGCSGGVKKAILWLAKNDISKGSNGKFEPKANCTRAQLAIFLYRYNFNLNYTTYKSGDLTIRLQKSFNFTDMDVSDTDFLHGFESTNVIILIDGINQDDVYDQYKGLTAKEVTGVMFDLSDKNVTFTQEVDKKLYFFAYSDTVSGTDYYYFYAVYATANYYHDIIYICLDADRNTYLPIFREWAKAADY